MAQEQEYKFNQLVEAITSKNLQPEHYEDAEALFPEEFEELMKAERKALLEREREKEEAKRKGKGRAVEKRTEDEGEKRKRRLDLISQIESQQKERERKRQSTRKDAEDDQEDREELTSNPRKGKQPDNSEPQLQTAYLIRLVQQLHDRVEEIAEMMEKKKKKKKFPSLVFDAPELKKMLKFLEKRLRENVFPSDRDLQEWVEEGLKVLKILQGAESEEVLIANHGEIGKFVRNFRSNLSKRAREEYDPIFGLPAALKGPRSVMETRLAERQEKLNQHLQEKTFRKDMQLFALFAQQCAGSKGLTTEVVSFVDLAAKYYLQGKKMEEGAERKGEWMESFSFWKRHFDDLKAAAAEIEDADAVSTEIDASP